MSSRLSRLFDPAERAVDVWPPGVRDERVDHPRTGALEAVDARRGTSGMGARHPVVVVPAVRDVLQPERPGARRARPPRAAPLARSDHDHEVLRRRMATCRSREVTAPGADDRRGRRRRRRRRGHGCGCGRGTPKAGEDQRPSGDEGRIEHQEEYATHDQIVLVSRVSGVKKRSLGPPCPRRLRFGRALARGSCSGRRAIRAGGLSGGLRFRSAISVMAPRDLSTVR